MREIGRKWFGCYRFCIFGIKATKEALSPIGITPLEWNSITILIISNLRTPKHFLINVKLNSSCPGLLFPLQSKIACVISSSKNFSISFDAWLLCNDLKCKLEKLNFKEPPSSLNLFLKYWFIYAFTLTWSLTHSSLIFSPSTEFTPSSSLQLREKKW